MPMFSDPVAAQHSLDDQYVDIEVRSGTKRIEISFSRDDPNEYIAVERPSAALSASPPSRAQD